MGLDQTAYVKSAGEMREIMSWRKHNALEGFMQSLWQEKGRPNAREEDPTVFNLVLLELTAEDIDMLEYAVREYTLPRTTGYFFGVDSRRNKSNYDRTMQFIEQAKNALSREEQVFYVSWW